MNKGSSLKYISLNKLKFDKKNIRFNQNIKKYTINDIFSEFSILPLMLSIGENGYFDTEPLIVIKKKKSYKVIDGNLRLASLKVLSNPLLLNVYKNKLKQILDETSFRPNRIPCIIIENKKIMKKQLGYKHITAHANWFMEHKRVYIQQLNSKLSTNDIESNARTIAKTVGTDALYILKYIIVEKLIELIIKNNEYSATPLAISEKEIYKIFFIFKLDNILNFIGITLDNNPFKKLNYDKLEIIIKLIKNCSNEYLEELNDSIENSYIAEQLINGTLFKHELKLSQQSSEMLKEVGQLNNILKRFTVLDVEKLNIEDMEILKSLHKKVDNFINYKNSIKRDER